MALEDLIQQGIDTFGFTREANLAAGQWAGAIENELHGQTYWMRPANLFAIWWGKVRPISMSADARAVVAAA